MSVGGASQARTAAQAHYLEVDRLVTEWLTQEGKLRLLASCQTTERKNLKRILMGKRSDAYRRMCSTPIDAKLVFRTAKRELSLVEEACKLAEELEQTSVQVALQTMVTLATTATPRNTVTTLTTATIATAHNAHPIRRRASTRRRS